MAQRMPLNNDLFAIPEVPIRNDQEKRKRGGIGARARNVAMSLND
jgi:hypothetical protein